MNGRPVRTAVPALATLQGVLAGLGHADVKLGCGEGVCGACTVVVDGAPALSCLRLAAGCDGAHVVTAAGLEASARHAEANRRLREHFVARESFQCGYCAPGMTVSATCHITSGGDASPAAVRAALASNLCRCTGYQQIVEAVCAAARGEEALAVPEPRLDIAAKVRGAVDYPTDHRVDGELAGRIVWAPVASARLFAIDARAARAIPGVVAILTHADIPGRNEGGEVLFARDQPLLAVDRIRSSGDAIALVVAETDAVARRAAAAIVLDLEPLPVVEDVLDALAHDPRGSVIAQTTQSLGSIERGFAEADVIVEGTYRSGVNDHACMEREGGVGWLDGDTLVVRATTLTPHAVRESIARTLDRPEGRIRVETPRMGGAFGKYLVVGTEAHLALMVQATGRPVRLVLDRGEIVARRPKRHSFVGRYRLGLARDGRFLALDADVIADAGAYTSLTPTVAAVFADEACGAYEVPNLRAIARGVLTNNITTAPMRGFGSQQINFGIESLVDKAARVLGMDPAAIRRLNLVRTRKRPRGGTAPDPTIALAPCLDRVLAERRPRPVAHPGTVVGRGLAVVRCKYGYPYGLVDRFVIRVAVGADGAFAVESDVADSGTGVLATAARIVARELALSEVPASTMALSIVADPSGTLFATGRVSPFSAALFRTVERIQKLQATAAIALTKAVSPANAVRLLRVTARAINLVNAATNWVKRTLFPHSIDSYVPRTSGSRGILMIGRAAEAAARNLRARATAIAAEAWHVPAGEVVVDGDGARTGERRLAWRELAAAGELSAIGDACLPAGSLLDPGTGNQLGPIDYQDAAHAVDLEIDLGTGIATILDYIACQDVGAIVSRDTVRGQVLGSIAMGVAQALTERVVTRAGVVENVRMLDYVTPTSLDGFPLPRITLLESGGGAGPSGSKGCGEASAVAAPIAIANALHDALGVQFDIPATPDDILAAIERRPEPPSAARTEAIEIAARAHEEEEPCR